MYSCAVMLHFRGRFYNYLYFYVIKIEMRFYWLWYFLYVSRETDEETFNLIKSQPLIFSEQDWANVSPQVIELIKKMLDRDQEARIKITEVVDFKWPAHQTDMKSTLSPRKSIVQPPSFKIKSKAASTLKAGNNFKKF